MDAILEIADYFVFDKAYASAFPAPVFADNATVSSSSVPASSPDSLFPALVASAIPRDDIYRQCLSLFLIASFGAATIYFISAALSYHFIFDKRLEYHPRFLKDQKRLEVESSLFAIPIISVLTLPFFLAEVRGYSLLYTKVDEYGLPWMAFSTLLYMLFNDIGIYWIHRLEHHPSVYKFIHKPHHKWIVPTPWAAIAFHPLDGYLQSLPYHIFVFICPMQKYLYMVLFAMVQIWTILIHDGDMITGHWLEKFVNSPAHHTLHHMYFTCNYGQYFTWADNYWDSHKAPQPALDPIHDALKVMREKGLIDENDQPIKKPKAE
ncbi:fatty acid hydroxylase superfamily-domain-containing protein [Dactylonectria macrodidyma]|uniref:Fatty acid hydroxylase superfamily-domain-containing protein n=1 Tax=Dactylonectria macrodidyma TaxID=307937 RepID=A0A9P9DLR6_9HYPO|nr:fatty acid hydroxylase superfamily-domain-containing protein [Dactylonectria macrodidyma]